MDKSGDNGAARRCCWLMVLLVVMAILSLFQSNPIPVETTDVSILVCVNKTTDHESTVNLGSGLLGKSTNNQSSHICNFVIWSHRTDACGLTVGVH